MKPSVTKLRKTILEIVENSDIPIKVKSIYQQLAQKPDLSTVYRALDFFQKKNLLQRINFFNKEQYYYSAKKPHRHFILCQKCQHIDAFNRCPAHSLEKELENQFDFKISDHFLHFIGLCKECQKKGVYK
jgi:Fur family ferric uptake transcriptional regulator